MKKYEKLLTVFGVAILVETAFIMIALFNSIENGYDIYQMDKKIAAFEIQISK